MTVRYRVGIIACGLIAEAHLRAYRGIPSVDVVAGADVSADVRERWSAAHGVPRMYASAAELLERERPDLVSICSWPPLRPELTELACAHGVKGIVAEKPMAVDLAGCDRMISAAERAGTVLIVGHQRRFHARYVRARELIDAGAIGQVVQISASVPGDLLTSATHLVDAMRFLLRDVEAQWVIGQVDRRDPGFTNRQLGLQQWEQTHRRYGHHIEAGSVGLIQFVGGVRGLVEVGIVARQGAPAYGATVYGTDGSIEISGDQPAADEPWLRARVKGEAEWISPPITPNNAFQAEIEALLAVLEHGGTHPLNMYAARKVHEILMAVYESARRRARIDLPYTGLTSPLEEIVAAEQR